jgi:hypothetical protein
VELGFSLVGAIGPLGPKVEGDEAGEAAHEESTAAINPKGAAG